ncbi:MAG: RecQ family ATP-dependent DNA helicase [Anaerolineae bacterium]
MNRCRMAHLDLQIALRHHFGFPAFRPGQEEGIQYVLAGRHVLVVMPTGAGKSLCYQLPALLLSGVTLVISPLIALMKDQVDGLRAQGVRAAFINSTLTAREQESCLRAMRQGACQIVYIAPERLLSEPFRRALADCQVPLLAVDEAHCISQWGHDFRPDYLRISETWQEIGQPPLLAATATATPEVQGDILNKLGVPQAVRIVTGFNRPNLYFAVEYVADERAKLSALRGLLSDTATPGIIYTGTRREAEEVADFVNQVCRIEATHYHAGLETEERSRVQEAFMGDRLPVVVATNAFGMGVDKADIRFVCHYNLPGTVEAYYQEAGRAGRDEQPARCVLLYSPEDRALQEWFIENDSPTLDELQALYQVLHHLADDSGTLIAASEEIEREIGLAEVKVRVGISELERAGGLRRLGDEYGRMRIRMIQARHLALSERTAEIEARREHKRQKLERMITYAEGDACRRRFILDYFGDPDRTQVAECCDNCQVRAQVTLVTRPASSEDERTALVILEAARTMGQGVGRKKLAQVLKGSTAKATRYFRKHRFYAAIPHLTLKEIENLIAQLMARRYLKVIGGEYPIVRLTPAGQQALRARAAIPLTLPQVERRRSRANVEAERQAGGTVEYSGELFRRGLSPTQIAQERGLKDSTIYNHLAQLIEAGQIEVDDVVPSEVQAQIRAVIAQVGVEALSPIKERLPEGISYEQIRCVVAGLKRDQGRAALAADTPLPPKAERIAAVERLVQEQGPAAVGRLRRERSAERLAALLAGEGDGSVRAKIVWALGETKATEAVPTLIAALSDSDGNVRRLAASALGKVKDQRAVLPLISLLDDEKPQVRQYAIKVLRQLEAVDALSVLQQIASDPAETEYNRKAAAAAVKALGRILVEAKAAIEPGGETDEVERFLTRFRPKPLKGPWRAGFALDFHSRFRGGQWQRSELGELTYRFKYGGERALGDGLARRIADFVRGHPELSRAKAVVAVPSTLKERAYDPVPVLAQAVARRAGLAYLEGTLVKTRATRPQKEMVNLAQKRANVQGAFAAQGNLRGKRLLLLDDLYDSGATLEEATRVLLAVGAEEVYVVAVTKTVAG